MTAVTDARGLDAGIRRRAAKPRRRPRVELRVAQSS